MNASTPLVSFVVPCYKLAHLLGECVSSILGQTHSNLEILIMDDQSPDNTEEVAKSFVDSRVRYIRNDSNLGNLRNYNAGIALCRGKYIWLISADDYLRRPYILERYLQVLEREPQIGYAFCSGITIMQGKEAGLLEYSVFDEKDRIVNGREFLKALLDHNFVLAPSALVRRTCYEKCGMFPLTEGMQWSGDWYLWCAFALHFDVAYFAEPMVCYRAHELSMTTTLAERDQIHKCSDGDLAVPAMIRRHAIDLGLTRIAKQCLYSMAQEYGRQRSSKRYQSSVWSLSESAFEESLQQNVSEEGDRHWVRARVVERLGDDSWRKGDLAGARRLYINSWLQGLTRLQVLLKLGMVLLGVNRDGIRRSLEHFRRRSQSVAVERIRASHSL